VGRDVVATTTTTTTLPVASSCFAILVKWAGRYLEESSCPKPSKTMLVGQPSNARFATSKWYGSPEEMATRGMDIMSVPSAFRMLLQIMEVLAMEETFDALAAPIQAVLWREEPKAVTSKSLLVLFVASEGMRVGK
jgi:hypothetical protein